LKLRKALIYTTKRHRIWRFLSFCGITIFAHPNH